MQSLFKIIALIFVTASAIISLLYVWTDIISEALLGKLLASFLIVAVFAIALYYIATMGGDKKLKNKGYLID